ncbi:MAG: phosphotransferase family protein [Acidimicrobiales bacterium]|nr:phosphotransferase family protein [Acidimicrobiales bacterium]
MDDHADAPDLDGADLDLPFSLDALARWMDRESLGDGPITEPALLAGGTQNILLHFRRGDRGFVMRHPPRHKRPRSDQTMEREARVLAAIADSGVPHPAFIASCSDHDVLGSSFYLMEPVEGYNPGAEGLPEHFTEADVRTMGFEMVDAIATLSHVDYQAVGLEGFGRPDGWVERQVDRWKSQLDGYSDIAEYPGPDVGDVEAVTAWLRADQPTDFQPGVLHGDCHFLNVLYQPNSPRLAALLDWELSTVADPLLDLGQLLSQWPIDGAVNIGLARPGWPTPDEVIDRYATQTDRDMSSIQWFRVLACYRLGIILEGSNARGHAGQMPRDVAESLHQAAVGLFTKAEQLIA